MKTQTRGDILAARIEEILRINRPAHTSPEIREALAEYRAPWMLGRSVNGFTLADGQQWHRDDFTEDMLPDGWRPLLAGEIISEGSQYYIDRWIEAVNSIGNVVYTGADHYRTRRPLPAVSILTPVQIADGWVVWHGGERPAVWGGSEPTYMLRSGIVVTYPTKAMEMSWEHTGEYYDIIAYRPDPYEALKKAQSEGKVIQSRHGSNTEGLWQNCVPWWYPDYDYRVKPEPAMVELSAEDVPPGSIFRRDDWTQHAFRALVSLSEERACLGAAYGDGFLELSFLELKENGFKINRNDGKGFVRCEKECK
jgi:hypothetical protein